MTFRNTGNAVNVFGTRNTCRFIVYSSILFSRSPGGGGGGYVSVVSNDEMQSFQQNGYHDDEDIDFAPQNGYHYPEDDTEVPRKGK